MEINKDSLFDESIDTPAFVYDETRLVNLVSYVNDLACRVGFNVLFTLKPQTFPDILELLSPYLDGFSVSSLFEARFVRDALEKPGPLHITTPGIRSDQIDAIAEACDYIAFNSLSQWTMFKGAVRDKVYCGLRINPQLSFVEDGRYDPCREHSKLGVPLVEMAALARRQDGLLANITGVHFHTNCDSRTFDPLLETVRHLDATAPELLRMIEWINLGGGYLFPEIGDRVPLARAVDILWSKYGLEVFLEPGSGIVRDAAAIVSTVIDIFESDGKTVAVLDTTVNHMPEVFEYQFQPNVLGQTENGPHRYLLAGCTCLAGDLFGEYAFSEPLEMGSRVVFTDMGAYTTVKWHWFNGVNLPAIYSCTKTGGLVPRKRFAYEDFAAQCGGDCHATL
ncbi:MAG: hypothetical protein ISS69_13975 [Phycisphaerae bacterium]|nr:hypothetical protein [Phycisphaerae bacterium]